MPLIRPEIQKVLRQAGLAPAARDSQSQQTISEQLDAAGLSLPETLEELALVAKSSGNESLRVRCLETVMKAHGALKETAPAPPSFTIIIQPSSFQESATTLQTHAGVPLSVNPIFLPRQLLNELESTKVS